MEPLNKKERKKAFWKFLAFFLVTVIFLMGAVLLNVQLPKEEHEVLGKKYEQLNKELEFQADFSEGIKEVKAKLDSINQEGQNPMFLDEVINSKLAGLNESVTQTDSLQRDELYNYVIQSFLALQESKRKLRDLQDSQKALKDYQENIKTYKEELEKTEESLARCRQLGSVN
jgi:DNA repair ATPase RecN